MTEKKQDVKEIFKILLKLNNNNLMLVSSGAELLLASQELAKQQAVQAPLEKPRQISILEYGGAKIT